LKNAHPPIPVHPQLAKGRLLPRQTLPIRPQQPHAPALLPVPAELPALRSVAASLAFRGQTAALAAVQCPDWHFDHHEQPESLYKPNQFTSHLTKPNKESISFPSPASPICLPAKTTSSPSHKSLAPIQSKRKLVSLQERFPDQ
jgi:hypothetical protein